VAAPSVLASPSEPGSAATRGSDFANLMRRVKAAGLLERRLGYYLTKIAVTGGLLATAWTLFLVVGDSWWQLAVAALLAIVFTQIGFLGHDAGHRQNFRSKRANYLVGLLHGNLAIGLSNGWWVDKHNRHHAHPNTEDMDPDIDIGALAFTAGQAGAKRSPVTRFIARHQRYLFFPPLLLEAVQLEKSSVHAIARRGLRHRGWEALMLGLHTAGYLTAVLLVLSPVKAVVFIVVQQALFGLYLGFSFAPNPQRHADPRGGRPERLPAPTGAHLPQRARQLAGRLRRRRPELPDRAPPVPQHARPNLRPSQLIVRAFCHQHGLAYCETTLLRSYAQAIRHLHDVGRPLRTSPAG